MNSTPVISTTTLLRAGQALERVISDDELFAARADRGVCRAALLAEIRRNRAAHADIVRAVRQQEGA